VTFSSQSAADDMLYSSSIEANMHFDADILCAGKMDLSAVNPVLDNVDCKVRMHVSASQGQRK